MSTNYNKHLTLDDRKIIERALGNGSSRTSIAETLGKNKSTICKEVKLRRYTYINRYYKGYVRDCIHMNDCALKVCSNPCSNYQMSRCSYRDRKVGVCNGCDKFNQCNRTRYRYDADKAHKQYREDLVDAREGIDLTSQQAKVLGDFIKPLIDKGQSPYAIIKNNPQLNICEKTLYNYIHDGVFSQSNIIDLDLRLKTKRTLSKKTKYKPREDRAYLKNRKYKDFLDYMAKHPGASVIEMDTVYNDETTGPFIQTFQIVHLNLMIGILHEKKTAENMVDGIKKIKKMLGDKYFNKIFKINLTDRGSEFVYADEIEDLMEKVFYCDPMMSSQKPNVERNHILLRYILPKKKNLYSIGLRTQEDLDLIFSHINSYVREELHGKSSIEIFEFYYPEWIDLLDKLNIKKIDSDKINLTPNLIKK